MAFSPDGKLLASVGYIDVGQVRSGAMILDVVTWETKVKLDDNTGWFHSVAFSADSKVVADCGFPAAKVWDTATGKQVGALYEENGVTIASAVFSPDGKTLALGAHVDLETVDPIRLWDWQERKRIRTLRADPSGKSREEICSRVAFLKDGKTLMTHTDKITLWDFDKLKPIKKIGPKEYHPFFGLRPSALSPDEKTLAQADLRVNTTEGKFHLHQGGVTLWSVPKNQELEYIPIDAEGKCVAFSPKGDILAVGCGRKGKSPTLRARGAGPASTVQYEGPAVIRLWDVKEPGKGGK